MFVKKKEEESKPEETERKARKYFEVFGDTINWLMFLRTLIIVLAVAIAFLVTILAKTIKKPPLVVKVDSMGRPEAIENWKSDEKISALEISTFVQTFMEYWMRWDYYTFKDDFVKAAKMMTDGQRQRAQEWINANNVGQQIESVHARGQAVITNITLKKDSKQGCVVTARGAREIYSYTNPDFKKEVVFEIEMGIKKIPRTKETPWGMLIDHLKEETFKEK